MGSVKSQITSANNKMLKEILIKLITSMVRQAHHERNQYITVRPEPVEGLNQSFLKGNPEQVSFRAGVRNLLH